TTPVLMVKYRPVGMRTATRMYDETVLTLSNTPWSISIELSLLRQSCCEDRRFRTPSVVGYSLPPVTAVRRRRPSPAARRGVERPFPRSGGAAGRTCSRGTDRIHVPSTRASSGACPRRLVWPPSQIATLHRTTGDPHGSSLRSQIGRASCRDTAEE